MRILHVNKFLYRRGGAEGYMEDVAALQRAAGDEVQFWGMAHTQNTHLDLADTYPREIDLEAPPGGLVDRARIVARMVWSREAERGIREAVRRFQPDVAHLHNVYHQLSPSILVPLAEAGVPVVMTLHDYKLVCPTFQLMADGKPCEACLPHKFWEAPRKRCRNGSLLASGTMALELSIHTVMRAYKRVDVFICPSQFLQRKMVQGEVFPDRMHVLRHFVDLDGMAVKEEPGGNVVLAGRLSPEKGVDVAIRAAALLPPGLHLDIAGDGPIKADLERLAAEVAPGRVTFHGRLPKDRLMDLLRSSSVAVMPSVWYENQPMAVLEAFGCGLPMVATDLGGVPELVTPGINGALVPPRDPEALAVALADVASDPDRALAMGRAGRERLEEEFTPAAHLAGLARLYGLAGAKAAA